MSQWASYPRLGAVSAALASLFAVPGWADAGRTPLGLTGIVEMPSAFHQRDAEASVNFAFDKQIRNVSLSFQTLDRLEVSFSVSSLLDPVDGIAADNTALNFKFLLMEESGALPALSLGIDDLFSNSRESAEYIVASKSLGASLRATMGLGWGRLGGYATTQDVFEDRPVPIDSRTEFSHLFRGRVGPFGGLEWDTPIDGLTLAAEYSSASAVPSAGDAGNRFNFAAKYRVTEGFDAIAYSRGGKTFGLTLSFFANAKSPPMPPDIDNVPDFAEPRPDAGQNDLIWAESDGAKAALRQNVAEALARDRISLRRFDATARTLRVGISASDNRPVAQLVGRSMRSLSRLAPPSVEAFEITVFLGGFPATTYSMPRDEMAAISDAPGRGPKSRALVTVEGAPPVEGWAWSSPPPEGFTWSVLPRLALPLDTDGTIDPELALFANGEYDLTQNLYVASTLSFILAGNQEQEPPPETPKARSDTNSYDRSGVRLDRLFGAYSRKIGATTYGALTFGILERQYNGVSAETVWLPNDSNWALGAELTYARKRDYDDPFGMLDFDTVTGFVSAFWDTGYKGVTARVDAGRYIAGDWGTTLRLSRSFQNNWDASAYVTLTENNSNDDIKLGARVSIPLATFAPLDTRRRTSIALGGNFGDAGARVSLPNRLMSRVRDGRAQRIDDGWSEFWN